jgi:ABC-type lipoprotein release transport system permease subunit
MVAQDRIRLTGLLKESPVLRGFPIFVHPTLAWLAAIGLYLALSGIAGDTTEDAVIAPWWALALIPIGTVLVVVAATILPALSATRIRTADALRYE